MSRPPITVVRSVASLPSLLVVGWLVLTSSAAYGADENNAQGAAKPDKLNVLFLGDNGHHQPPLRFRQIQPVLAARGVELTYSDRLEDLNPRTLAAYDALAIFANHTKIAPEQEQAILDYVASGKGLVPLHCASYCFLNSPKYIALVGAQFQRHGTGTFRTVITDSQHPIMKAFTGFESWDETYVHHQHNEKDRTVLEIREEEGGVREPWTWVRTQGKGRVFYTAWGHDERTWGNLGFQNLIERGIRWAAGRDPSVVPAFADRPAMTAKRKDVKPFTYVEAKVPFYPPGRRPDGPLKQMQEPLDPVESAKHFVMPVGFEPRLFVSEPQLGGKPIAMNWDERGRLWVCETVDYPNELQPPGGGRDRIRICEDTDGDGLADKFTVFADKLSIPTSLIFCRGGVIVHQAPDTLYLRDTNGDDVADERRKLFSGWATNDTHAGPSNLRYGLDNWYYGIVGYAGFEGTIGGERHSFRTGLYRMRAAAKGDASSSTNGTEIVKFEFLRNTNNNSWGVGVSEEGILFGSTANGNPSVYLPIANRYYETVRGWSSTVLGGIADTPKFYPITDGIRQVDYHGAFTAAAGHALYTARTYPPEYWNRTSFVTEPTGHLAATFTLTASGADFRARYGWNLVASDDEWSAPIMAEVGPDGHVWVVDWYNYIVQHNPTPVGFKTGKGNAYETDLRDKKHGRIYRMVYTPAEKSRERFTLAGADPSKLVATLKSDNMFWRLHAQRLLVERGEQDVVPALIELAKDPSVDALGLNAGATHALWTLHGLNAFDAAQPAAIEAAVAGLRHAAAGVRRNAIQVLPRDATSLDALLKSGVLRDESAQVRLAALLALSEFPPSAAAAEPALAGLRDAAAASDRWLLDAATSAAARHDQHFLAAFAKAAPLPASAVERIAIVAEHQARGGKLEQLTSLLPTIAQSPAPSLDAILQGWERGWPKNQAAKLDPQADEVLVQLVTKASPAGRSRLVNLATRWGSTKLEKYAAEVSSSLIAVLQDEAKPDSDRLAAAVQLVEFRGTDVEVVVNVMKTLSPRTSPDLARGLVEAAGRSDAPAAGQTIIDGLGGVTPTVRPTALRVLLARADWTTALLSAAEQGKIQLVELSLDQKQALAVHPDKKIADRAKQLLAKGGGLPNPDRVKVLELLMPLVEKTGNASLGKEVYKKQCSKCHIHSGEGTKIGPELTGMAVHPKRELLTHVIDPSRSVEGNYRVYTVVTDDGRVLNGLLASETKTTLELFDSEGKKHAVQRDEIEQLVASSKSLMPEGFEKQVTPDDIVNLLEFLTQRGKYLPIPLDKAATVVSTKGMFYSQDAEAERLIFADWSAKTFEGVPFLLIDPKGDRVPNAILLHSANGAIPPRMPKSVKLPCNAPVKSLHFLSGVSGWGFPYGKEGGVAMIVRLHYADGKTEDHELKNGVHFADYIRRVDVPGSKFAFPLRGQQLRYLAVHPQRAETIQEIELVKGPDPSAPVVMAVTAETK